MSVLDVANQIAFWSPIMLFSIGIPSALINTILFVGEKTLRQSPVCYYIVGQSISDISTLLILLLQIVPSTSVSRSSMSCKLTYFFAQTTVPCAMSFLCLSAFDRWACTSPSVRIRQISSVRIARCLFLLPFLFWPIFNIPFLLYSDLSSTILVCWFTNDFFAKFVTYFLAPFLFTIIPLLILILFGFLTHRNIRLITLIRQQHLRPRLPTWEKQMTKMMITQTFLSISFTFPRSIFLLYWFITIVQNVVKTSDRLAWELLFNQLTVFIICLNFISSFYIFLLSSSRFRRTVKMRLKYLFHLQRIRINPAANSTNT